MTQYSGKIIRKNPVTPTQQSASGVWTTADAAAAVKNNNWPVAGVPNPISRSVRLRSSATAYFNRTPASASNRTTWTWSGWVKRGAVSNSTLNILFSAGTDSTPGTGTQIHFGFTDSGGDQFSLNADNTSGFNLVTTQLFRDPSAWYHIVVAMDTTQATAANRCKLYVNGSQVTSFTTAIYPSQNRQFDINNTVAHNMGRRTLSATYYFDGYLTEINFIDGQALTPSSFGTTDSITGAWVPMPYTGTYGTNGFYLNFKDNTSTTTIGYDYSGNNNNWTANNISLTAGVTYDSMVDVPTLWMPYNTAGDTGALVRGNYAVGNPLYADASVSATYTNGNLTWSCPNTGSGKATISATTGKFYWEAIYLTNAFMTGVSDVASVGRYNNSILYQSDGTKGINGTFTSYGATYTTGDVIGVALDMDGGTVTFYKNNSSQGSISLSLASITNATAIIVGGGGFSNTGNWNFGQRPFTYTPPTGFKTLNTFNLPAPTINNGASYMAATLYTGNGTSQSISNAVNGVSFQPDFVWIKVRSASATDHYLADAVRGATKFLQSDTTAAEGTNNGLTAFNSNGFSVGAIGDTNSNTATLVGWQWNAGGSTVTNTSGTISAQVRANTTAGFSVVTYTGNGSAGATFGHGLGVTPAMIIIKARTATSAENWFVYQQKLTAVTYYLRLNSTNAQTDGGSSGATSRVTAISSSVITLGPNAEVNENTKTYVAYCFSAVAGYSAFGSYTGNGSNDGPFIYLGFRPRFVLIKSSTGAENWWLLDSARDPYNVASAYLHPNTSGAESSFATVDFLSNGFKLRYNGAAVNPSGATLIYAAFAENPFKYSNAR